MAGKGLATAVVVLCLIGGAGCSVEIVSHEIPNGFTGWVTVRYGDAGCASERKEGAQHVVVVQPDGGACTSFPRRPSTALAWFYYVDGAGKRLRELKNTGWGKGGEIWAEGVDASGSEFKFFVGTEAAFKSHKGAG